eukprot:gnl/TRDRNA2_/TRDRNA2_42672_c0_seq1.p1 gnl/TRDRNA2_/TRDRNA2_42672_c0~~gnl/TRDRNA2_/TRDRNA2_42672_c0_seq1.p1  ORF type:complete len:450 (+),score=83.08 gnl/TRDRNA2_/TRDRNA2_42672_c0_seq1:164-1351(+)
MRALQDTSLDYTVLAKRNPLPTGCPECTACEGDTSAVSGRRLLSSGMSLNSIPTSAADSRAAAFAGRRPIRQQGHGMVRQYSTMPKQFEIGRPQTAASRCCNLCVRASAAAAESAALLTKPSKVLVLGANGFVGQKMCAELVANGVEVVGLSRRGKPETDATNGAATYIKCDAANEEELRKVVQENGPFDVFVHAIGLLLDTESGLSNLNKFASGSGSEPSSTSTYDRVTRQTAFNAIKLAEESPTTKEFVFVSAAEAGWDFESPLPFLERYLIAKRAVEAKLKESRLREIIVRPSLIWTWDRPQALPSVIPFYIGNAIGIPIIDKPVMVEDLVSAAFVGMCDSSVSGVLRYKEIENLSSSKEEMTKKLPTAGGTKKPAQEAEVMEAEVVPPKME